MSEISPIDRLPFVWLQLRVDAAQAFYEKQRWESAASES
jgi:hypothetical protein